MIILFLFVQVSSLLDASALWLMSGRRGGIKQKVTRQEPHHLQSKSNQANQSSSKLKSDIELSDMSLELQQQPQPAQDEIQQQQPQLV